VYILKESKQVGIIYHYTTYKAVLDILKSNSLKSKNFGKWISFTRSKYPLFSDDVVQISFDGDKLSEKYKIEPFNFFNNYSKDEKEERIEAKEIRNIDKYIISVKIKYNKQLFNRFFDIDFDKYIYSVKSFAKNIQILKEVETTKGGRGPIGSTVKAPDGEYIHQRKQDPDKYTDYRTIKKNGKLLRLGKTKDGKWEVQSVLTKE